MRKDQPELALGEAVASSGCPKVPVRPGPCADHGTVRRRHRRPDSSRGIRRV